VRAGSTARTFAFMAERVPQAGVSPPWRAVVFILASSIGVLALRLAFAPLMLRGGSVGGMPLGAFVLVCALAGGLLVGHTWTLRTVEPRGWSYVRLGRDSFRARPILIGAAAGAVAIGVPSLILLWAGWLRIVPAAPGDSLGMALRSLIGFAPAAAWEELLVRGFFFALLREVWGTTRTVIATSLLFGAMHLQNPGATASSAVFVAIAGLFLGWVLIATESLYATWAAHLAWNVVMAAVLHTPVSGITFAAPNYRTVDAGPDWATGGTWGPEGGIAAVLGMAAIAGLLQLYRRHTRRQEHS
jgi:membrane protease YdiL (CAAX protease family)